MVFLRETSAVWRQQLTRQLSDAGNEEADIALLRAEA